MRSTVLTVAVAAIGISVAAAACGSEGNSASTATLHHRDHARTRRAASNSPVATYRAAAGSLR